MEFSDIDARILRYLEQRFLAGRDRRAVMPEDISRDNGIEQTESLRAVARLTSLGILEKINEDDTYWINDSIRQPAAEFDQGCAPPQNAPVSISFNYLHIEQASNSPIQQGTVGSSQTISHEPAANSRGTEICFDLSVWNEPPKFWRNGDDTIVTYNLERTDPGIRIQPTMGYLSRCEAGGPIGPLNYYTGRLAPFCWDFPQLDFKVLNNSPNTIYLTELILDVEESVLDPFPILTIKADVYGNCVGHFLLFNEGWLDLQDVTVRYALIPGEIETPPSVQEYPFGCHVGTLSHSDKVSVLDAFQRMGVDGAFQDGVGTVIGKIDFLAPTIDGQAEKRTIAFWTPVCFIESGGRGVLAPMSYTYQSQFEVGMSRYQRRVPLSQEVKSGDTDRFSAKIAVKKSSRHRFRARYEIFRETSFTFP